MALLANHIAVVTGAGSGIGRAIAAGYAREGAQMVLLDVNADTVAEAAQEIHKAGGKAESDVPADPSLPDYKRDVQFTVNGQFQPVIRSKAGQTEIWVLANVSDFAYMNVQLTETASGRHPPIAIVG